MLDKKRKPTVWVVARGMKPILILHSFITKKTCLKRHMFNVNIVGNFIYEIRFLLTYEVVAHVEVFDGEKDRVQYDQQRDEVWEPP